VPSEVGAGNVGSARKATRKIKESAIKTVEKIYGSFTGFTRSSTFTPRAKIAQQEVLEVPK